MIQLIASVIFIISSLGVLFILYRKIPVLVKLPQNGSSGIEKHRVIVDVEEKVKDFFISLEKQVFLHKLLSYIKVIVLKTEVKIDHLLHGIRKKAQKIESENNGKKKSK